MVFIIGGMTYAEAAALRMLSSRGTSLLLGKLLSSHSYIRVHVHLGTTQYVIGTTKLYHGDAFLDPLVERLF